jgi:hypothetical protein
LLTGFPEFKEAIGAIVVLVRSCCDSALVIIKNRGENGRGPMPTLSLFEAVKPSRRVLTNLSGDPERTLYGFGGVYVFDILVLFPHSHLSWACCRPFMCGSRYQSSRSPFRMKISRFSLSSAAIRPFLQFPARAFKLLGDELFVRKDSLILSREHLVREIVECVVGFGCSLFGAQN